MWTRSGVRSRATVIGVALLAVLASALGSASQALDQQIGASGPDYAGAYLDPTGSKPQSKLWFHDGSWWGVLFQKQGARFNIFRLDTATGWVDTAVTVDGRVNSRSDALWDGTHLYLASHRYSVTSGFGYPANLLRYSYDPVGRRFLPDAGFPVRVNNFKTETLVIDKDSTGTLWATWVQQGHVYVNRSLGDDRVWGDPFPLPVAGTIVGNDDISSLVAMGGSVGVMWGNQLDDAYYFAVHRDGDPPGLWQATETALGGPGRADDHLNLAADSTGRVWAVVKTGLHGDNDPLIVLLVRALDGTWINHTVATNRFSHTRPIVLLDEEQRLVHVLATGPQAPSTNGQRGGDIFHKSSSMDATSFVDGLGTPVMHVPGQPSLDNVTSTKQRLTAASGLVALAGSEPLKRYWYADSRAAETPAQTSTTAAPSTTTTTVPADRQTFAVAPTADSRVEEASPDRNLGLAASLNTNGAPGFRQESYITFSPAGLSGTVTSAKVRFYVSYGSVDGPGIYATSGTWTERGLTWANRPPRSETALADVGAIGPGTWIEYDVSSVVTGDGTYSFALAQISWDSTGVNSREAAVNHPQLVIHTTP
jgi:hypothetical protein